jgi:hypothetical protein
MASPINVSNLPKPEVVTTEEKKKQIDRERWQEKIAPYMDHQQMFEPRSASETDYQYQTRIFMLAKKYQKLSSVEQKFIHSAKDDGLHWRGHDFDFFKLAYEEHMKMQRMTNDEKMAYVKSKVSTLPTFEMPKAKSEKTDDPYNGLYQPELKQTNCDMCNGTGVRENDDQEMVTCPLCNGSKTMKVCA